MLFFFLVYKPEKKVNSKKHAQTDLEINVLKDFTAFSLKTSALFFIKVSYELQKFQIVYFSDLEVIAF